MNITFDKKYGIEFPLKALASMLACLVPTLTGVGPQSDFTTPAISIHRAGPLASPTKKHNRNTSYFFISMLQQVIALYVNH